MRVKERCRGHYNCELDTVILFFLTGRQARCFLLDKKDPAPRRVIDNESAKNGSEETGNGKDRTQNTSVKANFVNSDDFGNNDKNGRVDTGAADTLQCAEYDPIRLTVRQRCC